jgi:hypothetical protein
LAENALSSEATLHRTMLADSIGIRLNRSTSRPTGIVNTAPTSSATELSRPILVLPMCRLCSSWGATAPTVAVSAPLSASTPPNSTITRARAGPPTRFTTSPRTRRASHSVARTTAPRRRGASAPVISGALTCAEPTPARPRSLI